mmetsp:Transcript_12730/g.30355  ORF Transcript_12730/g.30355 Transcript_12730/m.30355 type:complete len:200 (+) Transcript_12730:2084-2683(+)
MLRRIVRAGGAHRVGPDLALLHLVDAGSAHGAGLTLSEARVIPPAPIPARATRTLGAGVRAKSASIQLQLIQCARRYSVGAGGTLCLLGRGLRTRRVHKCSWLTLNAGLAAFHQHLDPHARLLGRVLRNCIRRRCGGSKKRGGVVRTIRDRRFHYRGGTCGGFWRGGSGGRGVGWGGSGGGRVYRDVGFIVRPAEPAGP